MTLSIFDGVTSHWWNASRINADDVERLARVVLAETSVAQGVHFHSADEDCARGGGCFAIRLAT